MVDRSGEAVSEPQYVVVFGVQIFGPFHSDDAARRWMGQSDIASRGDARVVPLTTPEFDEPRSTVAPETTPSN